MKNSVGKTLHVYPDGEHTVYHNQTSKEFKEDEMHGKNQRPYLSKEEQKLNNWVNFILLTSLTILLILVGIIMGY